MVLPNKLAKVLPPLEEIIRKTKGKLDAKDVTLSFSTLIDPHDPDIESTIKLLSPSNLENIPSQESRALSCFICAAVADALGAHTEFSPFCYGNLKDYKFRISKFSEIEATSKRAKIGQWTDDTSMALCVADSLLENQGKFNGIDLRYRFLLWWYFAYNSGCKGGLSFGLGGNIKDSFRDFMKKPAEMTKKDKNNQDNGNGSLMRLAPVPLYFHDSEEKGMEYAKNQSFTTHNGEEAAECCRLLTHLIIQLINRKTEDYKEIFNNLKNFITENQSVGCLSRSEQEKFDEKIHPIKFNKGDEDRNWDWKSENYKYSPYRYTLHPGYFASYCMDALALSLHYAYHSISAEEAILRAMNAGGDSDTVGAITGQIVGAIYGLEKKVMELYKEGVVQWDDWAIATAAYKLFHFEEKNNSLGTEKI